MKKYGLPWLNLPGTSTLALHLEFQKRSNFFSNDFNLMDIAKRSYRVSSLGFLYQVVLPSALGYLLLLWIGACSYGQWGGRGILVLRLDLAWFSYPRLVFGGNDPWRRGCREKSLQARTKGGNLY
jgi:hypothetical protein